MRLSWLSKWCARPYQFPFKEEESYAKRGAERVLRTMKMPRMGITTAEAMFSATVFSKLLNGVPVTYLDHLPLVAQRHVDRLTSAHRHYGDSCLKRGGVGLFMMLARKWDRIERRLEEREGTAPDGGYTKVDRYDIFAHVAADRRPEGLADDVADLIDYLMIVEAELRNRGQWPGETAQHRPDQEHPFGYEEDSE